MEGGKWARLGEAYDLMAQYEWRTDLASRKAIFNFAHEITTIRGQPGAAVAPDLARYEAEHQALRDWEQGEAVRSARNIVFESFMEQKFGRHDVSTAYMDWCIDQVLWSRLVQDQNGFKELKFPWHQVVEFTVPLSWQQYHKRRSEEDEEELRQSKSASAGMDPWITNAEYDRMQAQSAVNAEKVKAGLRQPAPTIKVIDPQAGEIELPTEDEERKEIRIKLVTVEMEGLLKRRVRAGYPAQTMPIFAGCEPYELPLEQRLAYLVPPRDMKSINYRLPLGIVMLRSELGDGRIKLILKPKDGLTLGGGQGGVATSTGINVVWGRLLGWLHREQHAVPASHAPLRLHMERVASWDVLTAWDRVDQGFPSLSRGWEADRNRDLSYITDDWYRRLRDGIQTAAFSANDSSTLNDRVRTGMEWAIDRVDMEGSMEVRCWGAVEVMGLQGGDWRRAAVNEAKRRSVPCPMGMVPWFRTMRNPRN